MTFVCPVELNAFVKHISQWLGNLGEVLDEMAAITGKSEKASDLLDSLRRGPVKNSLNALWVDGHTILGDDMTKVGDFRKPEFALGILGIKLTLEASLEQVEDVQHVLLCSSNIPEYHPDRLRRTC